MLIMFFKLILLSTLFIYVNCSKLNQNALNGSEESSLVTQNKVLSTGNYNLLGKDYPYELIRLQGSSATTYVQWFPSSEPLKPVLIYINPYAGIDWSEDDTDLKWASRPNATQGYSYADEDGPLYDANTSKSISYKLVSPTLAAQDIAPYLANDVSVLIIYLRFYAGGNILNDIEDVKNGLIFINNKENVDKNKVSIYGASWGGFGALYGSARVPSAYQPKRLVSIFPASDIRNFANYHANQIPLLISDHNVKKKYMDAFDPYLRRIYDVTGGNPQQNEDSYIDFKLDELSKKLKLSLLVVHDDWDTVVPSDSSRQLVGKNDLYSGFWYTHSSDIDYDNFQMEHWQNSEGFSFDSTLPFVYAYMLTFMKQPNEEIHIFYNEPALGSFFQYIRNQQLAGKNIQWIKERLIEMCDPRINMIDTSDSPSADIEGIKYIVEALNTHWSLSLTTENVVDYLNNNNL